MKSDLKNFKNIYSSTVAIISSLIISGYWIFGNLYDVYTFAALGAIYEILWAAMVPLLFIVPALSLIVIIINKFKNSFFYITSIVICLGTFLWLTYY